MTIEIRWTRRLLVGALVLVAPVAWPQGEPLGPEFRVNTYTTNNESQVDVAADPSGNFVVVWTARLATGAEVMAQRFDSSGAPQGSEFRANALTGPGQYFANVASDTSGNFVVVWTSYFQDGAGPGVFGQRFAASGAPLGPEFRVNTYTAGAEYATSVAMDPSGNFVVTWIADHDGSGFGIFAHRFDSSGVPQGSEFRVNTFTTSLQLGGDVAYDPAGSFVVVWTSGWPEVLDGSVFGQRFAGSGAPLGPEFRINTYTTDNQTHGSVAFDADGDFVVVWQSNGQDGSVEGIFGQRFAAPGVPFGGEFRINTYTTNRQVAPSIGTDVAGNFVVVWQSFQDDSSWGIFGQRYDAAGPLGPEFRVNTYTPNSQGYPRVAAASSGDFVVVWESDLQDGSGLGVFGQRFGRIVPVEVMGVTVE